MLVLRQQQFLFSFDSLDLSEIPPEDEKTNIYY